MDAAIVIAAGSVLVAAGSAIFTFRNGSKATDVNARAGELGWVKELRQDALDTRKEMENCQQQVRDLSRQLTVVTREAEHWIAEYQFVHRTLWRNGISIERLRELLGPPPPEPTSSNGSRVVS